MSKPYPWCGVVCAAAICQVLLCGCTDPIFREEKYQWLDGVRSDLDPVSRGLDEYGTISISAPLLSTPDSKTFAFDLHRTADQYYQDARKDIAGASAGFEQTSSVISAGATLQVDVQELLKNVLAAYTGGLPALASASAGPTTLPSISVNVLPTTQPAGAALASNKFATNLALLTGKTPVMENRSAIITAGGDIATQAMLNTLAGPDAARFRGKQVLFGVSMVAVRPGSRTSIGYQGDVRETIWLVYQPVRCELLSKLKEPANRKALDAIRARALDKADDLPKGRSPLVTAVSPMTETQTLDLQDSLRRRQEAAVKIAAALSGFGAQAQSQFFSDWVKQLESDVATRSGLNVTSAYVAGANIFGFRASPRLRAIADPSNPASHSEMVLEPVTFPTLMLIGIDPEDLQIRAVKTPSRVPRCGDDDHDELSYFEPVLYVYQMVQWTPLADPRTGHIFGEPLTETQRLAWAAHLDRAMEAFHSRSVQGKQHDATAGQQRASGSSSPLPALSPISDQQPDPVMNFLSQEIGILGSEAVHNYSWQYMPDDLLLSSSGVSPKAQVPQVTQMVPASMRVGATTQPSSQVVFVLGKGLKAVQLDKIEAVLPEGLKPEDAPKVTLGKPQLIGGDESGAIQLPVTAQGAQEVVPIVFRLPYKDGNNDLATLTFPLMLTPPGPPDDVKLTRTREVAEGKETITVTAPKDVPHDTINLLVRGPTTQPAGNRAEVNVNVNATRRP